MTPPLVHVDAEALAGAPVSLIRAAVIRTLEVEGASTEISLALLPDPEIRRLNREYLDRDRATDVLAFSLGAAGDLVGDVYIGFERALEQANELGLPFEEELARLAIHGTLHVLGHDHPEGPGRSESPMFVLQERILREVLSATAGS